MRKRTYLESTAQECLSGLANALLKGRYYLFLMNFKILLDHDFSANSFSQKRNFVFGLLNLRYFNIESNFHFYNFCSILVGRIVRYYSNLCSFQDNSLAHSDFHCNRRSTNHMIHCSSHFDECLTF